MHMRTRGLCPALRLIKIQSPGARLQIPSRSIVTTSSPVLRLSPCSWQQTSARNMATITPNPPPPASSVEDVTKRLATAGITSNISIKSYPNSYPDVNPVDLYRSHITDELHKITGVDPKIIYPALQWTATLDKGDIALAVPALRIKGKKPGEVALECADKVCLSSPFHDHRKADLVTRSIVPRLTTHREAHRGWNLSPILLQACSAHQPHNPFDLA